MNDILEFIDELKELQTLYHSGELRDFDFATKIQKYERNVARFEADIMAQNEQFFRDTPFQYDPVREV